MANIGFIIMGAGRGTRMKSSLSKVMHRVAGLPMINHVLNAVGSLSPKTGCVVVGPHNQEEVKSVIGETNAVLQKDANGTASAVGVCADFFKKEKVETIVILNGDTPLINPETITDLIDTRAEAGATIAIAGFLPQDPTGYGRIMVGDDEFVEAIVEDKECDDDQRQVNLCYSGIMAVSADKLFDLIDKVDNDNAKGEYYLTDIIKLAKADGGNVAYTIADENEVMGCDSKMDLVTAEALFQYNMRMNALENGTHLLAPETVYFSYDTKIGSDVTIEQNVVFGTGVEINDNCTIRAFSHLEKCSVGENSVVGPYARLRPGAVLEGNNKIGNFVEVKESKIGKGSKVNHLTYIGDTNMGKDCNIGAGVITCNYNGFEKTTTDMGDEVFVGSNTCLVSPVSVQDGALIGAGSVVTKDVEKDALVIARANQENVAGAAALFRKAKQKKK